MVIFWILHNEILPIQDLPNHLANAHILLKYNTSFFFKSHFTVLVLPYPYILQDMLLALLMFGGISFASKGLVLISMVAIPLSVFYMIKVVRPGKQYLCWLSLPLMWNILLFKGNINCLLGFSLAFSVLAMVWKILFALDKVSIKRWAGLFVLVFLLYLAHPAPLLFCIILTALMLLYKKINLGHISAKYRVLFLVIASVGGVAFLVLFKYMSEDENVHLASEYGKIAELANLITFFHKSDALFLVPYFTGLAILIIISLQGIRNEPLPFIMCGILIVMYLLSPVKIGDFIRPHERILYFVLFLLPICCINMKYIRLERIVVLLLCSLTFLKAFHYFTICSDSLSPSLKQARNLLKALPREKRLLPIHRGLPYVERIGVWANIQAYYTIDNDGYVPSLFSTEYMPVRYRFKPDYSPYSSSLMPERLKKYDLVFVWGKTDGIQDTLFRYDYFLHGQIAQYSVFCKKY